MRIRLLIERNELPSVSVLWSFSQTQLTSTVAQFLEHVNVRFPLEGNTWGLEDYTVTLGGYEAQHYTQVGEVFKDDDEVIIKPLQFAEARARAINGRAQITADGRHLVDGVPFGKPLLKRMRRPEVEIPPARKRARVEGEDMDAEQGEGAVVRLEEIDEDEDEDEEDGDFEDEEDDEMEEDLEDLACGDEDASEPVLIPIRSIFSKQCCLEEKDLALRWNEDGKLFWVARGKRGKDYARVPGEETLVTIAKRDAATSWNHNAQTAKLLLKGFPSKDSNGTLIIEFADQDRLDACHDYMTYATSDRLKSNPMTTEWMEKIFVQQRKKLLDAHESLKKQRLADRLDDDDDEEDDGDFDDSSSASSNSASEDDASANTPEISSNESSDSSDSDSSDDSDSDSSDGESVGEKPKEAAIDNCGAASDSDASSSNVTWIGLEGNEAAASASEGGTTHPIPNEGKLRTKERNIRRREASRLKYLKKTGELPKSATLQQMKEYMRTGEFAGATSGGDESQKQDPISDDTASKKQDVIAEELEKKRQQLINDINGGGIDLSAPLEDSGTSATAPRIPANMAPPQVKRSKKKARGPAVTADDDRPEELPIATEPVIVYPAAVASTPTVGAEESPAPILESAAAAKRRADRTIVEKTTSKPMSAAQRLIFGSLGLKAPRTQADKDALQKKLADRSKKAVEQQVVVEEQEDEDPEAWREKVVMSAVECVDPGVELSEPPFPFKQKWDPQYWSQNLKKRGTGGSGKGKNKRRKGNREDVVETYDKYNQDGGGDALNYDDPVEEDDEWDDGENWEDGALLDDEEEEDDGFPGLPEDTSALLRLVEADAQVGDFVVFTEMACSDATGWQPQMVSTLGCLDSRGDGDVGWNVRFPKQKAEKEYDEEGNRIYKKFEMEGFDEEEAGEENIRDMHWAEMIEPKLLLRPAVAQGPVDGTAEGKSVAEGVAEQIQSQLEGEMGKEASSAEQ